MSDYAKTEYNRENKESSGKDLREGPIAKAIEQRTAKVPSDVFLWLAGGAIGLSAGLQLFGKRETSNFVGQWAPTILILGLYNKLVKVAGSDRQERQSPMAFGNERGNSRSDSGNRREDVSSAA